MYHSSFHFVCPRVVKGLHVNFAPNSRPGLSMVLSVMLGRRFPKMFGFTDFDVRRLFPCVDKLVVEAVKETGYMHIQATKPDTAGKDHQREALTDPPCFKRSIIPVPEESL